jgi:NADP+-dependent farnesol dehydrogenase
LKGAATAEELVKSGMIVVGLARRTERIEEIKESLPENFKNNLHALQCDVTNEEEVTSVFQQIDETYGAISILINCAGVFKFGSLLDRSNSENLKTIMNTNLFGTLFCIRETYHLMKKHGVHDGHIVNMGSILGHKVPYLTKLNLLTSYNIYPSSKFALNSCSEVLRHELIAEKSNIRITVSFSTKY